MRCQQRAVVVVEDNVEDIRLHESSKLRSEVRAKVDRRGDAAQGSQQALASYCHCNPETETIEQQVSYI